MNNLWLIIKFILLLSISIMLSSCCKSDLHGTYRFDSFARQYMLDTTITSFPMIDNLGFKESFISSGGNYISFYHGGDLDRCGVQFLMQTFDLSYASTINHYTLHYHISAAVDDNGPSININWYNNNKSFDISLYPKTGETYSGYENSYTLANLDSMAVRGKVYHNVMKIILWDSEDTWTLYIARPEGLIKLVRPDGIYSERL